MKIKRLKKIKINSAVFTIIWPKDEHGGSFSYRNMEIRIGTQYPEEIFETLCHELMEICACEMRIRFSRQDCSDDYQFFYDHRQHTTMIGMFSGALEEFL